MIANDVLFINYNYDSETDEYKEEDVTVRDVIASEVIDHKGLRFNHEEGWFRYNTEVEDGEMHLIKWIYDFINDRFFGRDIGVIEDGIDVRREIEDELYSDFYDKL